MATGHWPALLEKKKFAIANENLSNAKKSKNDEFYTQYDDINTEMNAYIEYNPDVFRNKTSLLPCDAPEWSNFTKYFATNFELLGIKKVISTSYAVESKNYRQIISQVCLKKKMKNMMLRKPV